MKDAKYAKFSVVAFMHKLKMASMMLPSSVQAVHLCHIVLALTHRLPRTSGNRTGLFCGTRAPGTFLSHKRPCFKTTRGGAPASIKAARFEHPRSPFCICVCFVLLLLFFYCFIHRGSRQESWKLLKSHQRVKPARRQRKP